MQPSESRPAPAAREPFAAAFWRQHGRAPRILHIGNIANNAYLNAKFLNEAGYDCDVLCYDYYHLMGCPEWEDAEFDGVIDHFHPDWASVDLHGFERPRWFAQGPAQLAIDYLYAKRSGRIADAARFWEELADTNGTRRSIRSSADSRLPLMARARSVIQRVRYFPMGQDRVWEKLEVLASQRGGFGYLLAAIAAPLLEAAVWITQVVCDGTQPGQHVRVWQKLQKRAAAWGGPGAYVFFGLIAPFAIGATLLIRGIAMLWSRPQASWPSEAEDPFKSAKKWPPRFHELFPARLDQLTEADCLPYMSAVPQWRRLLEQYDIVQAYATDVVHPLLVGKRPYIGFEHGTLRVFTLADNAVSRLTAMGYQQADHVFITNGDCLDYAHRINVQHFSPMIHPVDGARIRAIPGDYRGVHDQRGVRYVFVCPLRHDWSIKGTDKYIRALPLIVGRIGRNFRVLMTRWGAQLDDSVRLAQELGVADLIEWIEPLNRAKLVRLQKSSDVVFDQIALPHFGATAPQAIAAGVPVIMSYDPATTTWIIPEPAPILPAWSPEEVAAAVATALDPSWRADYEDRARRWFDTYHSAQCAVASAADVYRSLSRKAGLLHEEP